MPKKKKGLAAYKRAKKNNAIVGGAKTNPPPIKDLMEFAIPGFAGYAGTRMASRVVHGMVIQRFPKLAKHASVISTGIAALGAWLLIHRIDRVKQYHTPVVVGASIAAIQTVVQAYLPKYGWIVSDHNLNAQTPAQAALPPSPATQIRAGNKAAAAYNNTYPSTSPEALPPPITELSSEEVASELDDLDMGTLSGGFDLDDLEMDELLEESLPN